MSATVILLFALGLVLLIKGGDWFVDGATGIAHRFHMPELLIGATIVSIGTTLPEIMVSAQAAMNGNGGISYGNAIGSVICNTSLISALTVAIRPGVVDRKSLRVPVFSFFIAAVFYALIAYTGGEFRRWQGTAPLCAFAAYLTFTTLQMKRHSDAPVPASDPAEEKKDEASPLWKDALFLVLGATAIAVGANLLVDNGTKIAEAMGVPSSVIGLTMVALGTSLPELVTAITALVKGHSALSLGNIIGANLFNIVSVSGLAITIRPFNITTDPTINAKASLALDLPVMFAVMLILTVPTLAAGKLKRWQGILLLAIYTAYTVLQFAAPNLIR